MDGPDILARTLTLAGVPDKYGNTWQYHSQSDNHSKIACWALLFDLLQACPLLVQHVTDGKIAFGINHEMYDFRTGRKKNLDLVLCTPGTANVRTPESFASQAERYSIRLTDEENANWPTCQRLSA